MKTRANKLINFVALCLNMKIDFKNKTVWVIGASSGIGEALITELYKENCNIILSARREENLTEIASRLKLNKENSLVLPIDISDSKSFSSKIEKAVAKFKTIDIVILNAGIAHKSYAVETYEEVDRRIMEVNFMGIILFTKQIIPIMQSQGKGTIAVTSSILGEIGLPLVSTYCASKHAINGYFESLRYEVEKYNINISILSPGFIRTDITKNSLTASGEVFNKDSVAQEKGMPAEKCATKMISAIKKGKKHSYIGGLEVYMPLFSFYFPSLFYYLMKKMHKI